jgi:tetratricopeptide (TPR) repeat protein
MRRFDEADALLRDAIASFPDEQAPLIEYAVVANAKRNWPEAAQRWATVRERFPDVVLGYLRGASALAEVWRFDEAEQLLVKGMERFPLESALLSEYASIALRQRREDEAARRYQRLRERFPKIGAGYTGGALCLRNQFRLREAEELLEKARDLVPNDPRIPFEYAQLPVFDPFKEKRDYAEALRRLEALRNEFPDYEEGYLVAIRHHRQHGRFAEADTLALAGIERLPNSPAVAMEYGNTAREKRDWAQAVDRYSAMRTRFPNHPGATIGLAGVLSSSERYEEADVTLREAIERFPGEKAVFNEYGSVAVRRGEWKEALSRWSDAYRRFPDAKEFAHRIFEARLRLTESDADEAATAIVDEPSNPADPRTEMRDLISQFESLGGRGIGCEFGMFQREFAAEPLGLLRWADMPYDGIIFVLENRFDGVGLPENTELFLDRDHGKPEYCTRDKRGFMFQRCFIHEDDISYERMWKQTIRRLPFLRDKLITDLEAGQKIFVWRQTERNLTEAELDRLYRAVRSYGDNTLLYVRYQDDAHRNGTIEWARPGLLVGYIDRFKQLPNGELAAAPASASWTAICKNAFALWKEPTESSTGESEAVAEQPDVQSSRDLVMSFESLGGTGHGCEFGIFQRSQGAEPLGLLRWADLSPEQLAEALERRFEGVGSPEYTDIFVPSNAEEYWTTDKRFHMAMRSFIRTDEVTLDKVSKQVHRRLQFLREKLIEDLESGRKIFVYKNMFRNLTDIELSRLHSAVRAYGNNTLFYVRYEKPDRQNGTVETIAPGLMVGYMDHFAFSPTNEPLGHNTEGWLALCKSAYQTWATGGGDRAD